MSYYRTVFGGINEESCGCPVRGCRYYYPETLESAAIADHAGSHTDEEWGHVRERLAEQAAAAKAEFDHQMSGIEGDARTLKRWTEGHVAIGESNTREVMPLAERVDPDRLSSELRKAADVDRDLWLAAMIDIVDQHRPYDVEPWTPESGQQCGCRWGPYPCATVILIAETLEIWKRKQI